MIMPIPSPSDSGDAGAVAFVAEVDRDVFHELLASFDEAPPTVFHVKKKWPTRHVYFLQHPVGLFFWSETEAQDLRRAHVIEVKEMHFSFSFHY